MKHPVDTSQWGEFKLDDLFEFIGSKQVKRPTQPYRNR